jgi:16S rRNA G966 N2-methylase RsmD
MYKGKVNITVDRDLIEYIKAYAEEQRTTISEIFTQFILNLKRAREKDPTEIILADPDFKESLLNTISKIKTGKIKWLRYDEVF